MIDFADFYNIERRCSAILDEIKKLRENPTFLELENRTIKRPLLHYETFTERERQVLSLLAHGLSIKQICEQCFIEETTAKTHLQSIYQKTGLSNGKRNLVSEKRVRLVLLYLQHIGKLSLDWHIKLLGD